MLSLSVLTFQHFKNMFKKSFFCFLLYFLIVSSNIAASVSHWILSFRSPLQKNITEDINKQLNETDISQELYETTSDNATESSVLFWTMPDMNSSLDLQMETQTKPEVEVETTTTTKYEILDTTSESTITDENPTELVQMDQMNEENQNTETILNASNLSDTIVDEKIVLQRNNCNMEILIEETQALKIEIEFQKLENNTSGKCCLTLNGHKNNLLGVLISNIHLYQNGFEGEAVKVITADYGSEFVLKEYYSPSEYQPLLLTETHRVFVVLYYKVTTVPINEQNSHFNLEVFSYHKHENSIFKEENNYQPHFSNESGVRNFSAAESFPFSNFYR